MAGLCEGGNEPPGSLKASKMRHKDCLGSVGCGDHGPCKRIYQFMHAKRTQRPPRAVGTPRALEREGQ
ncbi:hypothetical protein ANN_11515 [Periplaneta americana]|uniref:Uncharacterized protein n=1 Tax=Periplaneta americana TaxID=6978 RepID=A0ABQ8T588_PERAM|nr:hypothetical protein ANN_11515 [Periplaneta americana]